MKERRIMNKQKMKSLLTRYNGVGVKVITNDNQVDYYFYQDLKNSKGIDRAYADFHKNHNIRLTFYSNKWAMQYSFMEYLDHYLKLQKLALKNSDDIFLQTKYKKYQEFLIKILQKYTNFSIEKATEQVLKPSISFNKFKESV